MTISYLGDNGEESTDFYRPASVAEQEAQTVELKRIADALELIAGRNDQMRATRKRSALPRFGRRTDG